ncbi:MAG: NADH-quinone oxidoreductase subunit G [Frankia sp.]|nr:NADH-quinone oxidoreductase subunit G [Frankia sp.]
MSQATTETAERTDRVTLTIDGTEITVPKGTLVIRAAEQVGVQVPRFCDHPLLDPIGACRQCIVEVEGQRKPLTACTTTVADGMVVRTQLTSEVARKAQEGTLELLLINHPLDCPICDAGGECPLQNQALVNGPGQSRFKDTKRTFAKPIPISAQVLLDRERCVLCARCTRFSQQIAGDPFIELFERGALEQVAIYTDEPFESYFSGNTIQICPVGALTGTAYRFRARPFDLVSTRGVCEHCASGCALRVDSRRGVVLRRLAGRDPDVNEEWNCDKGRWAFTYVTEPDRITTPLVRGPGGQLVPASWPDAIDRAAAGLRAARRVAVLTGGRLTLEDAYAYAKYARVVLGTNDIDFRARPASAEEADFLAARVGGTGLGVTYTDLESASAVLLAGLDPEEESPILFLRLRKAARRGAMPIYAVTPWTSPGLTKLWATSLLVPPGREADTLTALAGPDLAGQNGAVVRALRQPAAVILVGERLATSPGALAAAGRLADATGARLAWVPRRAGDRGAVEAGCLPNLLPGGRPVADEAARAELAAVWGTAALPAAPGLDLTSALAATAAGEVDALLVAGLDPDDLPDPQLARTQLDAARLLVSLELRRSAVTDLAHVVFPIAPVVEKAGSYVDWEGRVRTFDATVRDSGCDPDLRVLDALAAASGVTLGLTDAAAARRELTSLGTYRGARAAPPTSATSAVMPASSAAGEARLATWPLLLDCGRLQDGEPYLAATARLPRAWLSATLAADVGVAAGDRVTVSTDAGAITLTAAIGEVADRTVWVPRNSSGSRVHQMLQATNGAIVRLAPADVADAEADAASESSALPAAREGVA